MFGAWVLTANRYGVDGDGFFDGRMILADPLGSLRVKVKDSQQYFSHDIGFDDRTSWVRACAIKMYRWESMGLHFGHHEVARIMDKSVSCRLCARKVDESGRDPGGPLRA